MHTRPACNEQAGLVLPDVSERSVHHQPWPYHQRHDHQDQHRHTADSEYLVSAGLQHLQPDSLTSIALCLPLSVMAYQRHRQSPVPSQGSVQRRNLGNCAALAILDRLLLSDIHERTQLRE